MQHGIDAKLAVIPGEDPEELADLSREIPPAVPAHHPPPGLPRRNSHPGPIGTVAATAASKPPSPTSSSKK